jgi:hypothetical protein
VKAESGKRKADRSGRGTKPKSAFRFPLSAFSPIQWVSIATLLASIALISGCRSWNPWGKGFDDEYSSLGAKARGGNTMNPGAPSLGLSAKSRQIERNLGIE